MSEAWPFLSVVVPTYRRREALPVCLDALAGQAYPRERFEVVVVDDGSGASLEPVVAPFRDGMNVTLVSQPHAGPARARNTGAVLARGELLAFTDDDCAPDAGWLGCLAAQFADTPEHMIGGRTVNALHRNAYATASQLLVDYLYAYYNTSAARPSFFTSNNMALPRQAFLAAGGFDATLTRPAGEDRELCDRWQHLGYRMTYTPEALVWHHHRLTLRRFWRQHFQYGRAAYALRQARRRRGSGGVAVEPWSFYLALLRYPFTHAPPPLRAAVLSALLFLSQVANALGFLWECAAGRSPHRTAVEPGAAGTLGVGGGRGSGATPSRDGDRATEPR